VTRTFQLREINIVAWNVLNGGLHGFAEREGLTFDGNRMIWTWKLDLLFVHVFESFEANLNSGQVRGGLCNPPHGRRSNPGNHLAVLPPSIT